MVTLVQPEMIETGPLMGFNNAIINGGFEFGQRGLTFTANGYTLDRWLLTNGTGATNTIARTTRAVGADSVYALSWARSVAGTGNSVIEQRIENVETFHNRKITVAMLAYAGAATELDVYLRQNFGSGGSPSTQVTLSSQTLNLTTGQQLLTAVFDLPTVFGKILGTNNNDFLGLNFRRSFSSTNPTTTVFLSHIAVLGGDVRHLAQPFVERSPLAEEELCYRYYQKSYNRDDDPGTVTGAGQFADNVKRNASNQNFWMVQQKVNMRAVPTRTIYSPDDGASGNFYNFSVGTNLSALTGSLGTGSFHVAPASSTSINTGDRIHFHWTSDSEL